jgi:DNA-binding response OmpR family regulator
MASIEGRLQSAGDMVRHALIVDDEAMMRRLLQRALSQQGFQCDCAGDGNEAEEKAAKTQYDAVVTDLKMPNKHGHALATHLLSLEHRPVIVVHTGVIEPRLAKDLLARGVDDILFKPCDFEVLAAKVKALVQRRTAVEQRNLDTSADGKALESQSEAPAVGTTDSPEPIPKTAIDTNFLPSAEQVDTSDAVTANEQEHLAAANKPQAQSESWTKSLFRWASNWSQGS